MKRFKQFLSYVFPKYQHLAILNMVFLLFSILFGLFGIGSLIPILQILFDNQPMVTDMVPWEFSTSAIIHNLNYFLSQIIISEGKVKALFYVSLFVVTASFLKSIFWYAAKFVMAPLRNGVVKDIRNDIYQKIVRLHMGYFSEERKGDIMSRITNDVQEVEVSIVRSIDVLFKDPMTVLIYLIALVIISPTLSLFLLVLLPAVGFVIGGIGKSLRKKSRKAQSKLGDILTLVEETLGGLRIIKAFNAEKKMEDRFTHENETLNNIMVRMWRRQDLAVPLSEFLGISSVVAIMWFGGKMIFSETASFTPQAFIGYLAIFSQIIPPAKAFTTAFYAIEKGMASADRIDEVLSAEIAIKNAEKTIPLNGFNESIHYNKIFFKYQNDWIIKGIDLEIKKGQTVALVGQSGSGKSTLADLLPRFYDVQRGAITIDGIDIKEYSVYDLRKNMGIVNQESILFNDTIYNNIAFGVESTTPEKVEEAARIANAHDFILESPNGYQTNIGDRGGKLSGGQRQRISIARAVLANPPIMILDEATSALDTESEKLVQESLNNLMKNRTSIVIAHRLSTVVHADVICVIHEGQLIEKGTHHELLAMNGHYRRLHDTQMFN